MTVPQLPVDFRLSWFCTETLKIVLGTCQNALQVAFQYQLILICDSGLCRVTRRCTRKSLGPQQFDYLEDRVSLRNNFSCFQTLS